MQEQNPNPLKASFHSTHPIVVRLWHWLTYFLTTGALTSVFIATQVLNPRKNAGLVQDTLKEDGVSVTLAQGKNVAHDLVDLVWDWHTYIGYIISALLLIRLIAEFFVKPEDKFFGKIRNVRRLLQIPGNPVKHNRHYLGIKLLYSLFYIMLITMAITGLSLAFKENLSLSRDTEHFIKNIHSYTMYPLIGFIVSHIGGIAYQEFKGAKGIVSEMINGGKG